MVAIQTIHLKTVASRVEIQAEAMQNDKTHIILSYDDLLDTCFNQL